MKAAAGLALALLITRLRIELRGRRVSLDPADSILVFGAAVPQEGPGLSRAMHERMAEATELYHRGLAPVVACYGGPREVEVMQEFLLDHGVPATAIVLDETGTNTRRAVAAARARGEWHRVIVVSSSFHLCRIISECGRNGLEAQGSPAHRPPSIRRYLEKHYLRETLAIWWYWATAAVGHGGKPS